MYKHSILLLLSALAALVASLPTTPFPADNEAACDLVEHQVKHQCVAHLPPNLRLKADSGKVLQEHPEMCCPVYAAVVCIKKGVEQAPACKKFLPKFMSKYETTLQLLASYKCHVEKCKH